MATFEQTWNRLKGQVSILDPSACPQFVNDALRDIYQEMDWSFLRAMTTLFAPDEVTTGTVSVTRGSNTATLSVDAQTVVDALSNPVVTLRQVRFGGGQPYNISAYAAGVVTLDRAYVEEDNASSTYSILKCYHEAPDDFLKFFTVADTANQYRFHLHVSQDELDIIDPQRTTGNQPYVLADYLDSQYEMWPHPRTEAVLKCFYKRRGVDLTDDDEIPSALSVDLVLQRAKYLAYEWAEANKGSHPTLQKTNWFGLMQACEAKYKDMLKKYMRADRETYFSRIIEDTFPFRYDANFAQSHDVVSMMGGQRWIR